MALKPLKPLKPVDHPLVRGQTRGVYQPVPRNPSAAMTAKVVRDKLHGAPVLQSSEAHITAANTLRRKVYGSRILGYLSRKGFTPL